MTQKNSMQRQCLAVGLSFASAAWTGLQALHPGSCEWMGLDDQQCFALSSAFAALSIFLGAYILARIAAHLPKI